MTRETANALHEFVDEVATAAHRAIERLAASGEAAALAAPTPPTITVPETPATEPALALPVFEPADRKTSY